MVIFTFGLFIFRHSEKANEVKVAEVLPNSPVWEAGLAADDLILSRREKITTNEEFLERVNAYGLVSRLN